MSAPSLLHDLAVEWHLLAWGLALPALGLGALGAWAVAGGRPGQVRRALHAASAALPALAVAAVLPRLVQLLHPEVGGGPQAWILAPLLLVDPDTWLGLRDVLGGGDRPRLHPYDTAVLVHLGAAALAGLAWLAGAVIARLRPPPRSAPLPLAVPASVVLGLAAVLLPLLAHRGLGLPADVPALEWAALAPVLALVIGARLHGAWEPAPDHDPDATQTPEDRRTPDVPAAWRAAGVLAADAVPLARLPAQDPPTQPAVKPSGPSARAWAAADAEGPPVGALDELLEHAPAAVWLVGDLPPHTEDTLLTAFLAARVGTRGDRVLVVTPTPRDDADRLAAALERVHTWDPGHLAVGGAALREALARHRLPAVTFVTATDLARSVVPFTARDGRRWAGALTWMVLRRPDAGGPRRVTHTLFTLRRWRLALGDRPPLATLATGPDTPETLAFLEALLPGLPVQRCPLRPRLPGPVVCWPARTEGETAGDPWAARAARAALDLDVEVHLADPGDHLDRLAHQAPGLTLDRAVDPAGGASLAEIDATGLAEAWRAAHHRLLDSAVPQHHALWHVRPSPLGRFLTRAGRLQALDERRELPVPRPVLGTANRFLRLAHLRAALEDGHADEQSLRRGFGDDVVDFALREADRTGAWVARVRDGTLVRAPVLRGPPGVAAPEPDDEALTPQHIQVVDARDGEVLARVDRLVAATRYHPKRVFGLGPRRYRVPLHALDAKRGQLRVEAADPRDPPTRPLLRFVLEPRRTVVERVRRRQGGLQVTTLTLEVGLAEEVVGAWVPGLDQRETFDPVRATYDTEVRLILPEHATAGRGLGHLAGLVDALLPAHLRLDPDDAEVIAVGPDLRPGLGPGIAVVDRHVGGLGVARALEDGAIVHLLRWARAILYACPCEQGCARCTPEAVLRAGPDKQAVLRMLPVQE